MIGAPGSGSSTNGGGLSARAEDQRLAGSGGLASVARRLAKRPGALLSICFLIALFLLALFAPLVARYRPNQVRTGPLLSAPNATHWFGTDRLGRDAFSRVAFGSRLSLPTGLVSVSVSLILGATLGLLTGFVGGGVDALGVKITDIWLGFPDIMLALLVISVLGIGIENVVIAVGLSATPGFARIIRGSTLSIRENMYIEAARALGASNVSIIIQHVLPNVRGPIIVLATLSAGRAILSTSALGFLGMGVQPPTAEWGTMLSESRQFLRHAPWLMLFPGLMLCATVISINLLGDFLREILDPRLRTGQAGR